MLYFFLTVFLDGNPQTTVTAYETASVGGGANHSSTTTTTTTSSSTTTTSSSDYNGNDGHDEQGSSSSSNQTAPDEEDLIRAYYEKNTVYTGSLASVVPDFYCSRTGRNGLEKCQTGAKQMDVSIYSDREGQPFYMAAARKVSIGLTRIKYGAQLTCVGYYHTNQHCDVKCKALLHTSQGRCRDGNFSDGSFGSHFMEDCACIQVMEPEWLDLYSSNLHDFPVSRFPNRKLGIVNGVNMVRIQGKYSGIAYLGTSGLPSKPEFSFAEREEDTGEERVFGSRRKDGENSTSESRGRRLLRLGKEEPKESRRLVEYDGFGAKHACESDPEFNVPLTSTYEEFAACRGADLAPCNCNSLRRCPTRPSAVAVVSEDKQMWWSGYTNTIEGGVLAANVKTTYRFVSIATADFLHRDGGLYLSVVLDQVCTECKGSFKIEHTREVTIPKFTGKLIEVLIEFYVSPNSHYSIEMTLTMTREVTCEECTQVTPTAHITPWAVATLEDDCVISSSEGDVVTVKTPSYNPSENLDGAAAGKWSFSSMVSSWGYFFSIFGVLVAATVVANNYKQLIINPVKFFFVSLYSQRWVSFSFRAAKPRTQQVTLPNGAKVTMPLIHYVVVDSKGQPTQAACKVPDKRAWNLFAYVHNGRTENLVCVPWEDDFGQIGGIATKPMLMSAGRRCLVDYKVATTEPETATNKIVGMIGQAAKNTVKKVARRVKEEANSVRRVVNVGSNVFAGMVVALLLAVANGETSCMEHSKVEFSHTDPANFTTSEGQTNITLGETTFSGTVAGITSAASCFYITTPSPVSNQDDSLIEVRVSIKDKKHSKTLVPQYTAYMNYTVMTEDFASCADSNKALSASVAGCEDSTHCMSDVIDMVNSDWVRAMPEAVSESIGRSPHTSKIFEEAGCSSCNILQESGSTNIITPCVGTSPAATIASALAWPVCEVADGCIKLDVYKKESSYTQVRMQVSVHDAVGVLEEEERWVEVNTAFEMETVQIDVTVDNVGSFDDDFDYVICLHGTKTCMHGPASQVNLPVPTLPGGYQGPIHNSDGGSEAWAYTDPANAEPAWSIHQGPDDWEWPVIGFTVTQSDPANFPEEIMPSGGHQNTHDTYVMFPAQIGMHVYDIEWKNSDKTQIVASTGADTSTAVGFIGTTTRGSEARVTPKGAMTINVQSSEILGSLDGVQSPVVEVVIIGTSTSTNIQAQVVTCLPSTTSALDLTIGTNGWTTDWDDMCEPDPQGPVYGPNQYVTTGINTIYVPWYNPTCQMEDPDDISLCDVQEKMLLAVQQNGVYQYTVINAQGSLKKTSALLDNPEGETVAANTNAANGVESVSKFFPSENITSTRKWSFSKWFLLGIQFRYWDKGNNAMPAIPEFDYTKMGWFIQQLGSVLGTWATAILGSFCLIIGVVVAVVGTGVLIWYLATKGPMACLAGLTCIKVCGKHTVKAE